jgi:hypothetical protein
MSTFDPTQFMTPREKKEYEKNKGEPSPYRTYTYAEWKALGDPEVKVLKPQSAFERDYDKVPEGSSDYIKNYWGQ